MATRIIEVGDTTADFHVGSGSAIVQMEVGAWDGSGLTSTTIASTEEWHVEQADADIPDSQRVWSAVHNTGTNFNGLGDENRTLVFATSPSYIYRVRKATTGPNANIAVTWAIGTTRKYI